MPAPGAAPIPGQDNLDLGGGLAGTRYADGSVVVWRIAPPHEEVAYIEPNKQTPSNLGDGRAAYVRPDGGIDVFDIANPPAAYRGTALGQGETAGNLYSTDPNSEAPAALQSPGAPRFPGTPAAPSASNYNPIGVNGYGSRGFLPSGEPRLLDPAMGQVDFGRGAPVQITQRNQDVLGNPALQNSLAPGYIPGSGTYNQYRLDAREGDPTGGLFGTIPGQSGTVNLRFGLGGTGDPTNGSETQTPDRWFYGTGSTTPQQGDAKWRATGGTYKGGGGWDSAWAGAVPGYRPGPGVSSPGYGQSAGGFGASGWQNVSPGVAVRGQQQGGGYGGGYDDYGGGMGGGYFTNGPGVYGNWGQTDATRGKDYIATVFMRPDAPNGISSVAWSAPDQMWQGLLEEIRSGRVVVASPDGWAMLRSKNPAYTPQNIGGAALTGQSGASAQAAGSGAAGSGSGGTLTDAAANAAAAAAADKAAYWAYQQALLRQGDRQQALAEAQAAWTQTYQTSLLTGQLNGQPTLAAQAQEFEQGVAQAGLTGLYNGAPTMAREQMEFNQKMQQVANELAAAGLLGTYQGQQTLQAKAQEFSQQMQQQQFGLSEAGVTGTYQGAPTLAAIGQQNQTALGLLGLQAQLQGPRNWSRYQSTFGSTPQGLQDVMAAFQGRYQLPTATGAQNAAQGGQQSVQGLAGDILSGTYGQDGQSGAALGNPRQADLQNWARMQPSQREMVLGQYENEGWYGPDVENLIKGAAPRYSGPQTGSYNLFQS